MGRIIVSAEDRRGIERTYSITRFLDVVVLRYVADLLYAVPSDVGVCARARVFYKNAPTNSEWIKH